MQTDNNNTHHKSNLYYPWLFLKIVYGFIVLIAGLDKFFGILSPANENIISSFIRAVLPIKIVHFFYIIGVLEIINGIMILTNWTYWGAYILMAWYLIIDINLLTTHGFYLIIMNNFGHAAANFALAKLTAYLHRK
jgi:hypothetical protein